MALKRVDVHDQQDDMDDCLRHSVCDGGSDDDLKIGIKSTAILFGRHDKLIIGVLQLVTLAMLVGLGQFYQLGQSYYWTVLIAASLFVYQQHLIRHRERDLCFRAFLNNNYVGMVIAIGLLVAFW